MDLVEEALETRLAQLHHTIATEQLELEFGPEILRELRAELAAVEHGLDRNYTYLFPLMRRRLKAETGTLHRRIALQAIKLQELRERHPELVLL